MELYFLVNIASSVLVTYNACSTRKSLEPANQTCGGVYVSFDGASFFLRNSILRCRFDLFPLFGACLQVLQPASVIIQIRFTVVDLAAN